jgi:hypothetical protein
LGYAFINSAAPLSGLKLFGNEAALLYPNSDDVGGVNAVMAEVMCCSPTERLKWKAQSSISQQQSDSPREETDYRKRTDESALDFCAISRDLAAHDFAAEGQYL